MSKDISKLQDQVTKRLWGKQIGVSGDCQGPQSYTGDT